MSYPGVEAYVIRCPGCGAWTYAPRPCTVCALLVARQAVAA